MRRRLVSLDRRPHTRDDGRRVSTHRTRRIVALAAAIAALAAAVPATAFADPGNSNQAPDNAATGLDIRDGG
jgi:hypothetical protein